MLIVIVAAAGPVRPPRARSSCRSAGTPSRRRSRQGDGPPVSRSRRLTDPAGARRHHPLRRPHGGVDFNLADRGRASSRPHRPERRGQDDGLQHAHRRLQADRGRDPLRGRGDRRHEAVPRSRSLRRRAHVPEHPPVQGADRARQREGRRVTSTTSTPADRGRAAHAASMQRRRRASTPRRCELLEIFGLGSRARGASAKNLPYGDQRRLEIARALATRPQLLLLDEPAAGMNPQRDAELMDADPRDPRPFDIAILLVEHNMELVMGICERIARARLRRDDRRWARRKRSSDNPKVIEAYLGELSAAGDLDDGPAEVRGICGRLRRDPGAARRRPRRAAGRDRHAHRRERRGQDDDAAHDLGPAQAARGQRALRRRGHRGALPTHEIIARGHRRTCPKGAASSRT